MSQTPDTARPDQAAEGIVKADKRGRMIRNIPVKSLLRRMKSIAQQVNEEGTADHRLAAEMIGLLSALAVEEGLTSEEVPLRTRVEWALRTAPMIAQLREGWGKKKETRYPKTVEGVKNEIAKRTDKLKMLAAAIEGAPKEAVQMALDEANDGEEVVDAEEVD